MKMIALLLLIALVVFGALMLQQRHSLDAPPDPPVSETADKLEEAGEIVRELLDDVGDAVDNVAGAGDLLNDAGETARDFVEDATTAVNDLLDSLPCVLNCE